MVNKFEQEENNVESFDFSKFEDSGEDVKFNLNDVDLINPKSEKVGLKNVKHSELFELGIDYDNNDDYNNFLRQSKYVKKIISDPNNRSDFYLDSIEDIFDNFSVVLKYIKTHNEKHNERHKILNSYYEGNNYTINNYLKRRKQKNKSDFRLNIPYCKTIVDSLQAYTYTNNIVISDVDSLNQEFVNNLFNKSKLTTHNKRLASDTMIFGHGYEINYRDYKGNNKLKVLSVYNTFIIYTSDIEKSPLCGVYYVINPNGKLDLTLYLDDTVIYLNNLDSDTLEFPINDYVAEYNGFGDVQIVEYLNNDEKMSSFEHVISLVDASDSILSDIVNVSSDTPDALLKIQGVVSDDSLKALTSKRMKDSNVMYLEPSINSEGDYSDINAEYMTNNYDINGNKLILDMLSDLIYTQSNTPNFSDKSFGSATSGIALQTRLYGTDIISQISQSMFKEGLSTRYLLWSNLYTELLDPKYMNLDLNQLDFLFVENVPVNVLERIDSIVKNGGKISNETLIKYLPDTDWETEKNRLAEEKLLFENTNE